MPENSYKNQIDLKCCFTCASYIQGYDGEASCIFGINQLEAQSQGYMYLSRTMKISNTGICKQYKYMLVHKE